MSQVIENLLNSEKGITVAISTLHLDIDSLLYLKTQTLGNDDGRIAERRDGYFIKLSQIDDYNTLFPQAPHTLIELLMLAQKAGVSVLEIDTDAEIVEDLPLLQECP